ncbi:MAG: site-specific integrase [Microbacterium sp.]|jgi:integrase|nr:site-specific integrase [Microbacterium sp.]
MAGTIAPYETAKGKRYRVRYRKPNGAQTDKRGFKTKREAELFLASTTISKASGQYLDPSEGKKTIAAFAEQWKRGRLAGLKPSSQNVMETAWRVHVEPRWGTRGAASIRPSEIEDWVAELHRDLASQTVRRAVFVLSSVLAIAERDRIILSNPAKGLQLPPKTKKPQRYLTHEQVEVLARHAEPYDTVIRLLAYSGLRWGEAIGLRVRHLDMLRRRLLVEDNAVWVKGQWEIGTPKTGDRREVAMPVFLIPELARLCEGKSRDAFVLGPGVAPIPRSHGATGWFVRAVRAAQTADRSFPTITPHDLRHTAASLAISAGANVKAVQRMLGHASAAMTLDVYADLFDDDLEAVAVAMSKARAAAVS